MSRDHPVREMCDLASSGITWQICIPRYPGVASIQNTVFSRF
ncbi:hypothetical protein BSU04_38370 [Caballeronia sordidicola]|uniref:Uncharacterized protein n=1 Tax=Caballeronia sordidicola TaxID=196367 RepID=A0A226WQ36_CABSO|nr:hypothetical protein BSU04_38370 [Caballeronia sordidicola]